MAAPGCRITSYNVCYTKLLREQLNRNIERISTVVKTFLRFANRRVIQARLVRPADLALEVTDIYASKAEEKGVELTMDVKDEIRPAPLDYDAIV